MINRSHLHTLPTLPTLETENQILLGNHMRNPQENGQKKQRWEGHLQSNKTSHCIKLNGEHRGWRKVWHNEGEDRRRPQRGKHREKRQPRDRKGKRFELKHSELWEILCAESSGKLFCAILCLSSCPTLFLIVTFFSMVFSPKCQSFPFWFLPASHYSTSRWLGLKREAPETARKLRKEGHI